MFLHFLFHCLTSFKPIAGYTVTVMGQSDADRVFHVRAIGVSTNSTERVGTFYFRAWSARVPLFRPRAYLGDAAHAYANAAAAVFDSVRDRLMCFAHVYKVRSLLPISECCVVIIVSTL
jgi:hypothetical protein